MDAESLRDYIDWYKDNFAAIFYEHEGYKWQSIQTFQREYRPDKEEFPSILEKSFKDSRNLLNCRYVYPLGMLLRIAKRGLTQKKLKVNGIELIFSLLEETNPRLLNNNLLDEISKYRKDVSQYVKDYLPDCNNNYQDLHAVSVYLSHRYPDIYYIYRPWEFESFNRLIGNEYSFKRGKDQNYISYLQLCNDLNAILRREIEIDEGFKYEIDTAVNSNSKYYKDPEYHILTQDFIYSIVNYYDDDMTGRYDKVLKNKPIVPEVEEITVEELSAANTTKNTNKKTEQPIKIDYVARQRVNSRLGNTGERWAEEFERKRLTQGGRKDLAKKVERVSKKDDSLGYDIASFNLDGTPLWIEVKTTNEGKNTPFFISDLELKTCQENLDKYRLYRVYNLTKGAKVRIISGDLNKLNPVPTTYRIKTED